MTLTTVTSCCAWITARVSARGDNCKSTQLFDSKASQKIASRSAWAEDRGIGSSDLGESANDLVTVIGGGRIGSLLASGEGESILLGRGDSISSENEGTPILIATRNDSLDEIVDNCPENRKKDLVFMQNGYLDEFLTSKGLMDNTQVLLYLSVTAKGVEPVDGVTSVNPEGLTAATGVHAQAFANLLEPLGLKCNVITPEEYRPAMFEKLIWISTYMLVGTAKECKSVGEAGTEHKELVEKVITELLAAVAAKEGIEFASGSIERLAAYTDVVADFPCGVKEFEWRNQYFYNLGDDACPTHNSLLKECAEKGFLSFSL